MLRVQMMMSSSTESQYYAITADDSELLLCNDSVAVVEVVQVIFQREKTKNRRKHLKHFTIILRVVKL